MSKNEHFHLNIKLKQWILEEDEFEKIREAANDVYEELSHNDPFLTKFIIQMFVEYVKTIYAQVLFCYIDIFINSI